MEPLPSTSDASVVHDPEVEGNFEFENDDNFGLESPVESEEELEDGDDQSADACGFRGDFVDFLKDFGSSETFLVDGDSLVLHSCGNNLLDWTHGGQYLHLVFIVEQFLANLKQRGGLFEVFFMKGNEAVFDRIGPAVRLAREVVLCHLIRLCAAQKGPRVNVVAGGWRSHTADAGICKSEILHYGIQLVSWPRLLGTLMPAFVMTDYHEQPVAVRGKSSVARPGKPNTAPAHAPAKSFVQSCVRSSAYVILFTGIEFKGSRIYGFLLSPVGGRHTQGQAGTKGSSEQESSSDSAAACMLQPDAADTLPLCSRICAAALGAVLSKSSGSAEDRVLAAVVCVADALRRVLPMNRRSLDFRGGEGGGLSAVPGLEDFVSRLQREMATCIPLCAPARESALVPNDCGVADLYDGRLLFATLMCVVADSMEGLWDSSLVRAAGELWACVSPQGEGLTHLLACAADLFAGARTTLAAMLQATQCRPAAQLSSRCLVPLDAARDDVLLSQVLGDLQQKMAGYEDPSLSFASSKGLFKKDHHFHNIRPLVEDMRDQEPDFLSHNVLGSREDSKSAEVRSVTGWAAWRLLRGRNRNKQKMAAAATRFEESLLYGTGVQSRTITCSREEMEKECEWRQKLKESSVDRLHLYEQEQQQGRDGQPSNTAAQSKAEVPKHAKSAQTKQGSKSKKPVSKLSKADEIRMNNQARKNEENARVSREKVQALHSTNEKEPFDFYEQKMLGICESAQCAPEASAYGRLLIIEKICGSTDTKKGRDAILKIVFVHLQGIIRCKKALTPDILTQVHKWAQYAGFNDLAQEIERQLGGSTTAKTKTSSKSSSKNRASKFGSTSSIMFQLQGAPEHLERPAGVGGESRVAQLGFSPDKWQQKLLDIIDSDNSALVIAPTAAGKTFISYYIMERCLRSGNSGIVVFVAPTKALVNQVKAEICARFNKPYPEGGVLAGAFTRDYRENETTCQILVTVPQCLEILLLSPANIAWSQRIQHVILDEVHNIGEENGECWERIILLCKAPILGLSATLGDVHRFVAWLKRVEEAKGRKLYTVSHSERWNDLATWVYDPSDVRDNGSIEPLHPCTAVLLGHETRTIPEDLKLLPEHCVELFKAMQSMLSSDQRVRLDPETYFRLSDSAERACWDLSMRDVAKWEVELKQAFNELPGPDQQDKVLDAVCGQTRERFRRADKRLEESMGDEHFLLSHVIRLIRELREKNMMPAICFHMSRGGCERLAKRAAHSLIMQQNAKRQRDGWKSKVEKILQSIQKLEREKCAGASLEDLEEAEEHKQSQIEELKRKYWAMTGVDREFTFFPEGFQHLTEEELDDVLPYVPPGYEWLKRAMLRGVAVHHSGLNKKVRQAVERLFRKKLLVVVFATGTLAMGINMPCRTSIFAGDAVYINAMSYRQMAGRAGRRGFDLRGNVVFFGMPSRKINRLMRSKLPVLQGNQILSASTVLRLIMMHAGTVHKIDSSAASEVVRSIVRLVGLPHHDLGLGRYQAAHTFRFCMEFLCREGMLSMVQADSHESGRGRIVATDLAGLISHIHYVEPSNFAFYALLKSGVLHKVCTENTSTQDKAEELLAILCHLFNRTPIAPHIVTMLKAGASVSPSKVLLDKLRGDVKSELQRYNRRVLTAVIEYQMCFAKAFESELGEDNCLPLSGLKHTVPLQPELLLPSALVDLHEPVKLRSAFVALSGRFDDDFQSIGELCFSMRNGLYLDPEMIPAFEPSGVNDLNSYALDFYKHGQIGAITRCNMVSKDDAFFLLYDMSLILKALAAAMRFRYDNARREWSQDSRIFADIAVVTTLESISETFEDRLRSAAA